jgi:hypothetical protein
VAEADDLDAAYAFAFRRYAQAPSEHGLQAAYELGRSAVRRELSLLDLALAHHAALLATLHAARGGDVARVTDAAADFLVEALSAYEMQGRGFRETQERAQTERRHAEMLRRLSTFLAEASLADVAAAPDAEILRLVAEQAREMTGAVTCVAWARRSAGAPTIRARSQRDLADVEHTEDGRAVWAADGWDLALAPPVVSAPAVPGDGVTVPIATAGRAIGELTITRHGPGAFTAVDRAVLVHLAQMTASALERAWRGAPARGVRHRRRRRSDRVARGA